LAELGLLIPRGYALPTSAFTDHLARAGVVPARLEPGGLEAARRAILDTPLDSRLQAALDEAALELDSVAIRSSLYPYEDHPNYSCAGLFESWMNVAPQDLSRVVRACYASVFSESAWDYFARHDLPPSSAEMALCVQQTID